jgi:DNA primase
MVAPVGAAALRRIDWQTERERIDLAAVATSLLGPAPGRRGERGRRLWWPCPFHEDRNPSLSIEPGKHWWRCFGCGANGDAAALVMRLRGMTFPEARGFLTGGPAPPGKAPTRPVGRPAPELPPGPSGLPEADALALVEAAAARLWSPEGSDALAYLTGSRCLSLETVRAARLGWTPGADGVAWRPPGVVIPWFHGPRLALVKVRPPDAWRERFPEGKGKRPPKYIEGYRDPAALLFYPGPEAVRPGRPLVVAEGELDALALGEALGGLAAVVTLGSASARPEAGILARLLAAPRWYIATDGDQAGDRSAAGWPARARRVRPPAPFKDWTEAKAGGVDLARWWRDILAGIDRPPLYTWDDLSRWRWGAPECDASPGIIV